MGERSFMRISNLSYWICTTPRTGSTLLCDVLRDTGVAGQPQEYFYKDNWTTWFERLGVSTFSDMLPALVERTKTDNNVFGVKIMTGGHLEPFVNQLRQLPQYQSSHFSTAAIIADLFPNLRYIWLTRRNKVRQAVSHWRAIQSHVWHQFEAQPQQPEAESCFQFEAVDTLVQDIVLREAAWQEYFSEANAIPLMVVYKDFIQAPEATARSILSYLGIAAPEGWTLNILQEKQLADQKSEVWVQEYREQKQTDWGKKSW